MKILSQPTIKDVAKLAGVSISTVSRVINESKPVSPEARRRVLDAIEKLDFKPNELARSLVMKRSNLIGVIVKDIGINYMAQIIRGIEEIGRMYKYDIMLSSTYGDLDVERNVIDFLLRKQVEGLVLISENTSPEIIYKLKQEKPPFILLDRYSNFDDSYTVRIDYDKSIENLVDYLVEEGHKRIMFVDNTNDSVVSQEKLNGYIKSCEKHGFEPLELHVKGEGIEEGYHIAETILSMKEKASVVMFSHDDQAIGFINYCYDNGIRVPDEISVTGFGDIPMARHFRPRLTTVQEPFYDIGAVAMRILVKVLRESFVLKENTFLPSQIMKRDSVKTLVSF